MNPSDAPAPAGNALQPKDLPALDRLLRQGTVAALVAEHGHSCVAQEARGLLDTLRQQARAGKLAAADVEPQALAQALARRVNETPGGRACAR
jgi:L-seryl-tRNA(Ser) seleniumtransferase